MVLLVPQMMLITRYMLLKLLRQTMIVICQQQVSLLQQVGHAVILALALWDRMHCKY